MNGCQKKGTTLVARTPNGNVLVTKSNAKCSNGNVTLVAANKCTPQGPTNLVGRTVFVDSIYGSPNGQYENPQRPFSSVRRAIKVAAAFATQHIPVQVSIRAGIYTHKKPICLANNVTVVGAGTDSTIVYGNFFGDNVAVDQQASLQGFSIVSYYDPNLTHNGGGQINITSMNFYLLSTPIPAGTIGMSSNLVYPSPDNVPTYPNKKFQVVLTSGNFYITNSKFRMEVPNPASSSDTAIFNVTNSSACTMTLEKSDHEIYVGNTLSGSSLRYISQVYTNTATGSYLTIRAHSNRYFIGLLNTNDSSLNLQIYHSYNGSVAPQTDITDSSGRNEYGPFVGTVATTDTGVFPFQSLIKIEDTAGAYLSTYYHRVEVNSGTSRYLYKDVTTNKFSLRSSSQNALTVVTSVNYTTLGFVPPVDVYQPNNTLDGGQCTAQNKRNGGYVADIWYIAFPPSPIPYPIFPNQSIIYIQASSTVAGQLTLPLIDSTTQRELTINNQSSFTDTVFANTGNTIFFGGVQVPSIPINPAGTPGSILRFWSPATRGNDWNVEVLV